MKKHLVLFALPFLAVTAYAEPNRNMDSSTPPNDAEISQIVITADKGEIEASKLAKRKSANTEVKEFADMMIDEHASVTKQTKELASKLKMKPKDSKASKDLAKSSKDAEKKLKSLKGADFDKQYVDQMVSDHQAVLDTIDSTLLPNAKNEELKNLIQTVRPSVAKHLEHAKALQAKLGDSNAG